jgi:uncharacterized protein
MPDERVLIVALSGRALARSARAAGFAPVVLDLFADLDMREAAAAFAPIAVDRDWRFAERQLLEAASRLGPPPMPLVWGSGLERSPDLLAALARGRPLWGAPAALVRRIKDPAILAAACERHGLPHPEIRLTAPRPPEGWLVKRAGGAGGGHVRPARARPPEGPGWYWQRRVAGRPASALVLGTGSGARVLGLSAQWALGGRRGHRFAGVAVPAAISEAAGVRLRHAAETLGSAFGLEGLFSVDALVEKDRVWILEINPRPGASLDAFELAHGRSLFALHAGSFRGEPAGALPPAARAAASEIVYAPRQLEVRPGMAWPAWTADRGAPGTKIPRDGPICTVLATGTDRGRAMVLLRERARLVLAMMTAGTPAPARHWPRLAGRGRRLTDTSG